jgi:Cu(I)/Ag(I) efflux system membrane fusion protein
VPSAFRVQLQALFKSYEKISSALIASDPTMVPAAVSSMRKVLDAIDGSLLSVEMKLHWVEMRSMLRKSLDALRGTRDIKKQRAYYSGISNTLYDALKHYGIDSGTIYRQYCPMAFDNKGAFWLSSTKEIRNPFFGEKMLKCGSTKEELK